MKRKCIVIIMAVVIMAIIVTFSMIGCRNTINSRPASTAATTAAPTS